jgi:hypothetical protein
MVGTITDVFDRELAGTAARLVRRRRLGYTVELLASKPPFQHGDIVHLSPAEFLLPETPPRPGAPRGVATPSENHTPGARVGFLVP